MRFLTVVSLLLASIPSAFAAQMSHEETVVRTAYAKFAYASEQNVVMQLAVESLGVPSKTGLTSEQRLDAAKVSFALSDFVIGNAQDIINRKVSDYISPASGRILQATSVTSNFGDGTSMFTSTNIELHWSPVRSLSPEDEPAEDMKLGDLYKAQWRQDRPETAWQRYASYSVVVTFQGEAHGPYKAMFIFGHNSKGEEVIQPVDSTTDADGLALMIARNLFPAALVSSRLRTAAVVADWIETRQLANPSCSVGQQDVCCDLARMQCGPGRADVTAARSQPLSK